MYFLQEKKYHAIHGFGPCLILPDLDPDPTSQTGSIIFYRPDPYPGSRPLFMKFFHLFNDIFNMKWFHFSFFYDSQAAFLCFSKLTLRVHFCAKNPDPGSGLGTEIGSGEI